MKWLKPESYSLPVTLALGLHLGIVAVAAFAVDFSDEKKPAPKHPPVVNAKILDISQTIIGKREAQQQAQQAAAAAEEKRKQQQAAKREADKKALAEQKRKLAQAKKEKAAAVKKQQEAKRKAEQKAEQERQAKIAAQKKKDAERAAAEKRKQQEAEKKRQEEAKQKAAAEKAAQQRREQEAREREAERQRLAQEAEEKRRAEQQRQAEIQAAAEAEQRQRQAAEAQMVQSISGIINNRIVNAWNRPANARNGMQTLLRIFFLPSGEVLNVEVIKRSGDDLFDQRAVDAVNRVGQIEELQEVDSYVFERNFRQVELLFNPTDLRN
ncbi:cell envelope integrity protein TolA [Marinomonas epiphytica]